MEFFKKFHKKSIKKKHLKLSADKALEKKEETYIVGFCKDEYFFLISIKTTTNIYQFLDFCVKNKNNFIATDYQCLFNKSLNKNLGKFLEFADIKSKRINLLLERLEKLNIGLYINEEINVESISNYTNSVYKFKIDFLFYYYSFLDLFFNMFDNNFNNFGYCFVFPRYQKHFLISDFSFLYFILLHKDLLDIKNVFYFLDDFLKLNLLYDVSLTKQ